MSKASPAPTATSPATTKQVSGPAAPARSRAAPDLPAGWGDTVHETSWTPPEESAFGAVTMVAPEGAATEQPFVAEAKVEEPAKPEKVEEPDGDETPVPEGDDPATEPPVAAEPEKPAAPESSAMLRRKALDALRIEGENRALQARLKAEQDAKAAALQAREAEVAEYRQRLEKLKTAPLAERLKEIGIETQDELFEAGISGRVKMPEKTEAPVAPAEPERVARLEAELHTLRIDSQIRAVMQQNGSATAPEAVKAEAARLWQAAGSPPGDQTPFLNQAISQILTHERTTGEASRSIRDELAKTDTNPAPFVRATQGALDAVAVAAMDLWRNSGAKAGDFARCAKLALDAAEEMYTERYRPVLEAAGHQLPAKAAAKPTAAAAPPARPAPPIGKKAASRATADDDDGPMDPALNLIWVKEQMRKAGHKGW